MTKLFYNEITKQDILNNNIKILSKYIKEYIYSLTQHAPGDSIGDINTKKELISAILEFLIFGGDREFDIFFWGGGQCLCLKC